MSAENHIDTVALAVYRQTRAERALPRWRRPALLTLFNRIFGEARTRVE